MTLLRPILRLSAALPLLLASLAMFALMVLTFSDVVLRSTFNAPIEAATELTRLAMAVVVFAALPILSARGGHISVDLLDGLFDRWRLARWRDGIVTLACGVILWFPAGRVVDLAERARSYGDRTEYLGIPDFYMAWFIAAMTFVTAALMILRGLLILIAPRQLDRLVND